MATRRRSRSADDAGHTLIFVVLVSSLVMIVVTTSIVLSTANVRPARAAADSAAALAAAQAGTDLFAVALASCGDQWAGCAAIATPVTRDLPGADGAVQATYTWDVRSDPATNALGMIRVAVTGQVRDSDRTLVTDFRPTPSFLDYLSFTERETVSPATIATYEGPRTVALPTAAIRARATRLGGAAESVTWAGAAGTNICTRPWYDLPDGPGRASMRGTAALPLGMDYAEVTTDPAGVQRFAACEVAFGSGATMTGKVYSKDAYFLTNSVSGGPGPMFADDVITEWGPSRTPAPATPGRWFRSNPQVGGDPRTGSAFPQLAQVEMSMPSRIDDIATTATCVFTGPTRIELQGLQAVVTSPGTNPASLKPGCVPSGSADLVGSGLVQARFPLGLATVFYVRSGGVQAPASPSQPLFDLRSVGVAPEPPGTGPARFYAETATTEASLEAVATGGDQTETLEQRVREYVDALNLALPVGVGEPAYGVIPATGTAPSPDPMLETGTQAVVVQRRECTAVEQGECVASTPWSSEFTVTVGRSTFPLTGDVTPYTTGVGSAFVQGALQRPLTIATEGDVVVSDDLTYASSTAILGLVANADVELYHPVSCRTTTPVTLPGGTCPDDITGLYTGGFVGADFDAFHPSRQYLTMRPDLADLRVDGAVLARDGSLVLQNYQRGPALGTFTLLGGVYQRHRGATGVDWEAGAQSATRERSGYVTTMTYDGRLRGGPPPSFVKPSEVHGSGAWQLVGTAERQGGG